MDKSPKFIGYILAFVGAIFLLMTIGMLADMLQRGSLYYNGKPLWMAVPFISCVCFISLLGSIRIFYEKTPIFPLWLAIPFLAIIFIAYFIFVLLGKIPPPQFIKGLSK